MFIYFHIHTLSNSRENARAARRANHHANRQDSVAPRAVNHRQELDTLNRSNVNKRGPKVEGDVGFEPAPHGYSKLRKGITCSSSNNIITLADGTQCREGSLTHLQSIHN